MVKVRLRGTFGYGRPRVYYGPGLVDVPEGLAQALGLKAVGGADTDVSAPDAPPPPDRLDAAADLIDRLGVEMGTHLALEGFTSIEAVRAASDEELLAIKGIGPATLRSIRAALQE
jgi:DNA integrity scanning protein DisA with diadenylate cyclase activity